MAVNNSKNELYELKHAEVKGYKPIFFTILGIFAVYLIFIFVGQ